ncbi:hypothetical protein PXH66_12480 [Synoicihabitans lomoniglobus]|uniref:Uncharacterized protein n=1 Tax=Synoicihabitans lomoniglobus TaxID=2909285 RepID=A0AAE9ZS21_9BACT|nr:hypothetical protein PXH66_12480 [Opitutaceae bacterium LMO-M01]
MRKLRILAEKTGSVPAVTNLLNSINDLYIGLYVLERVVGKAKNAPEELAPEERLLRSIFGEKASNNFDFKKSVAEALEEAAPLELTAASFSSPGFWEFLGSLNPLQQIREWIKDSHERRKDKKYREGQEERENNLKIEELQIKNLRDKIAILREVGVPEEEIRTGVRELIGYPLKALRESEDHGLIESAEIMDEERKSALTETSLD